IAQHFREARYDIKVAVGDILRSDAFYAQDNRGVLVKSPVELVVGTLHQLDLAPADTVPFAVAMAGMGQNLFSAPNVKGWPGGEVWINTSTLLARKQFLERITRGNDGAAPAMASAMAGDMPMQDSMRPAPRQVIAANGIVDEDKLRAQRFARQVQRGLASVHFDSARWMAAFPGRNARERNDGSERLLLATAAQQAPDSTTDPLSFVRAILLDAAYQVK